MKAILILLLFPLTTLSQQRITKETKINLHFSSFCNYDYDLERCTQSSQVLSEIAFRIEEGGSGRMVLFISERTSFTVYGMWSHPGFYSFDIRNNKNSPLEGYLYFDENRVATKFILRVKGSQESMVFY